MEARRLLVSFKSVGRFKYEWRFEPLAVASIRDEASIKPHQVHAGLAETIGTLNFISAEE